jgi:hypothetical protein
MSEPATVTETVQVDHPHEVNAIPAPTAGPLVFAFGTTFVFAGIVTHPIIAMVGAICSIFGGAIWWQSIFPREHMEAIPAATSPGVVPPPAPTDAQLERAVGRTVLPIEVPRVSAGIKGGLAGGAAMAVVAIAWGIFMHGSVWLPINLLAGVVLGGEALETLAQLSAFSAVPVVTGVLIHLALSVGVGLLFGICVPMMPRHPVLFGGIVAPLVWSALIGFSIDIVNPVLAEHVDWTWFIGSQLAFGVVTGFVVGRSEHVKMLQYLSPAERIALERSSGGEES